jgi:hypothetical protein
MHGNKITIKKPDTNRHLVIRLTKFLHSSRFLGETGAHSWEERFPKENRTKTDISSASYKIPSFVSLPRRDRGPFMGGEVS